MRFCLLNQLYVIEISAFSTQKGPFISISFNLSDKFVGWHVKPFVSVKEDFSLVEKSPLVISAFFGNVSFSQEICYDCNECLHENNSFQAGWEKVAHSQ